MSDLKKTSAEDHGIDATAAYATSQGIRNDVSGNVEIEAEPSDVISLVEESLAVSKRAVVTGEVKVSTRTETHEELAEVTLDRNVVDVIRVPIGHIVEEAPKIRTVDDTTIVPIIEERFVVVKQLFLKEELHIKHRVEHEVSLTPVTLRRQTAVVERLDPDGVVRVERVPEI